MPEPRRTAHDLVTEALRLLLAKDMAGFAGLWAADGILEFPFAPASYPRQVDGRDAIAAYLRDYPDLLDVQAITDQTLHDTTDPDIVILEFEVAGAVVRTGQPYRMRYIAVVTARDGEIAHYRDYWSPLAAAEAFGGLEELSAAFTGGESNA
jgi:ketosteroid isomerase-like protein